LGAARSLDSCGQQPRFQAAAKSPTGRRPYRTPGGGQIAHRASAKSNPRRGQIAARAADKSPPGRSGSRVVAFFCSFVARGIAPCVQPWAAVAGFVLICATGYSREWREGEIFSRRGTFLVVFARRRQGSMDVPRRAASGNYITTLLLYSTCLTTTGRPSELQITRST
jgi:hypothetical protein